MQRTLWWDVGFLMNEKIKSFVWLFETFMETVDNVQLKVMMTDQAFSMTNAIEKVFPLTKHRLFTWHILKNSKRILIILEYWMDLLISLTIF